MSSLGLNVFYGYHCATGLAEVQCPLGYSAHYSRSSESLICRLGPSVLTSGDIVPQQG